MLSIQDFIRSKDYDFDPQHLDGAFHEITTDSGKVWYKGKTFQTSTGKSYNDFKFGNYKEDSRYAYPLDTTQFTKAELKEIETALETERVFEATERAKLQEEISERSTKEMAGFGVDVGETGYAQRKKIGPVPGALLRTNPLGEVALVIPMKDHMGKTWGYQSITESDKTFVDGQKMSGLFFQLGQIHGKGILYLCEGVATAMSIFLAKSGKITDKTGQKSGKNAEKPPESVKNSDFLEVKPDKYPFSVICCFNGGNLRDVAQLLRREYKDVRLVICSDNDNHSQLDDHAKNVGIRYAFQAAHYSKATVLTPDFSSWPKHIEGSPKDLTDFNDMHVCGGLDRVASALYKHRALGPEQVIPTEYNGFHAARVLGNGHIKMEPQYTDLAKWTERETPYKLQAESEQIYVWNGMKYVDTPKARIRSIANRKFWIDWEEICNNHMRSEFLGRIQSTKVTDLAWFSTTTKDKINFQNGMLNTTSGEMNNHSPEFGFRNVLTYDYNPTSTCPAFDEMMENITQKNEELTTMLLEYMGYCLSGDTPWMQKALVCVGEGANGKSTFFNILRALIGEENVAAVNASGFDNPQNMYLLDGMLLNVSEETGDKALFKTSEEFKNLVTGGNIVGKKLYAQPYQFKNKAKLILSFNTFPRASDTSHGLNRRLLFANFNAVFDRDSGNLDLGIEDRALGELSGIFNKAWGAYQEAKKRGHFTKVEASNETLKQFQYESDNVLQFFDDHCSVVNGEWLADRDGGDLPKWTAVDGDSGRPYTIVSELYLEYNQWCKNMGKMPLNDVHFSRRLYAILRPRMNSDSGVHRTRKRIDGVKQFLLHNVTRSSGEV